MWNSGMLVGMWLALGIAGALAGPGDFGKNFTVSFADEDQAFEQEPPQLWILSPGEDSTEVVLRDDGSDGDAEAGDAVYSGTFNELPDNEVVLVIEGPTGEIWRRTGFFVPADMQYPALRLTLKDGVVEGGLKADLSPEEQRKRDLEGHAPNRETQGSLRELLQDDQQRVSLLVLLLVVFFPPLALWGVRRARDEDRGFVEGLLFLLGLRRDSRGFLSAAEVQLPEGLPVLEPGLQVWGGDASFESLRTRIAEEEALNCELFWLPSRRLFGHDTPKNPHLDGAKMSLAEALRWRRGAAGELPRGPIFVEGLQALHTGYGCERSLWEDLQSLARDCPVVILRRQAGRGASWVAQGPPEEWLQGADEDPPLT